MCLADPSRGLGVGGLVEGLQHLIDLQALDDQLRAVEDEYAAVPVRRDECKSRARACEEKCSAASEGLSAAEREQRRVEGVLQEQEALLLKLEGQQLQVKTNDAYTALLQEMEGARRATSECETQILEAMEAIEEARGSQVEAEAEREAEREQGLAETKTLDERERELNEELTRLRPDRDVLCGRLESGLLSQYARIAKRRSPAVVQITNERCVGCQMNIPPQNYIEILKGEKIITCGNCTRILVHAERVGEAASA